MSLSNKDSKSPELVGKMSVSQLQSIKSSDKQEWRSLSFACVSTPKLNILFPPNPKYGQLDPPLAYRVSASKVAEWRRLGTRSQQEATHGSKGVN